MKVARIETLLAKDIVEYGVAFEYRRKRRFFKWLFGEIKRKRINPAYLVIHKEPTDDRAKSN